MAEAFAAILRAGILPGIGKEPAFPAGFKAWVLKASYFPSIIDERSILLNRVNLNDLSRALSFDYERFALSAHESFLTSMSEHKEYGSLAWPLLKSYYSAFFSAHAIMRARGAGVLRIDKDQSKKLSEIIQIFNSNSYIFSPGMYFFYCKKMPGDGIGEVSVKFSMLKDGKGVHEGFWDCFSSYIESEASEAASEGRPDHVDFVAYGHPEEPLALTGLA